MIVIHPNWQSTDASPSPPPKKEAVHIRIGHAPDSRRPAAILGVSLVLLLGLLLVQNAHSLAGQLTEASSIIRITAMGLEPASITVPSGATITWKNMDTKPHILSSDTLVTTDGLLYSTAIFPEEEFRATLADQSSKGEYPYVSLTDPTVSGTVHIDEKDRSLALPKNPLVAEIRPPPPQNTADRPAVSPKPPSRPKPFRNPETGIPLGISFLATFAVVLLLTRRILCSQRAQAIRP
ncbi:cupredoxin domain-containing protein [Candidatus Peregrinibacteria bacterium]|nr:cupredoxin domain-containing protein [Candidatus Peregrinibacteria bacterium]MBI2523607.1 cupredoxin domain-containing protein [Candidatus Peregrinibacteria bacterium]MBI4129262.1 cupredoxin domain-containing protein [Candidatus Peregrinibacteria bacterium]